MKEIIIAIIDSGVCQKHPLFAEDIVEEYEYISRTASFREVVNDDDRSCGHGTAIYNIIRKCKDYARIINIRVADIEEGISEELLISILQAIGRQFRPNIINLSLGLNILEQRSGLYEICKQLTEEGCILVSAFDNTGSISYPAAFDVVIGVITGQYCTKTTEYEYVEDSVVNVAAKGGLQRVAWSYPQYIMIEGNSFACAHVTVGVAQMMLNGIYSREWILAEFKNNALRKYKISQENVSSSNNSFDFPIKNAVVFPFNKEMHSIIRYQNLLTFNIVDVYDSRYSTNIGASTNHLLKCESKKDFSIKNISDICWDNFDTLIIGHLGELSNLTGKTKIWKDVVSEAICRGKNIYSFDPYKEMNYEKIFCPIIEKCMLPSKRFGMLYRISKPVVGIFGTSSRQGKFTLQLKIREILLQRGYSVGQIGTEPSSLLFGMDYVFPMGYNSSVYISGTDTIRYLNYIMNRLCEQENDIIIVGSQSGTITYDTGNLSQYNLSQYEFLLGTQPDAVVLCINPYDDVEHIVRTINFLEASLECKVIATVVFPMTIKDQWSYMMGGKRSIELSEFEEIQRKLSRTLNISIYNLSDSNQINDLVDEIIEYFV